MRTEGRILSLSGGLYSVETESGILLCFAKGSFRKQGVSPVAGDLVVIDTEEKIGNREKEQGARGVITQILPRKNVLYTSFSSTASGLYTFHF